MRRSRYEPLVQRHRIEAHDEGGTARVVLGGEIDISSVRHVRAAIGDFIGLDDIRTIELDLADVTFIDSAGIGVVIGSAHRAKGAGQRLEIVAASQAVQRVLDITGVSRLVS